MKKYYFLAILVTCTALFTGCQDDLVNNTTYNDGYLHFKFLFDKQGQWKEDGASGPQTRMMAPIEMTLPEGFDTPLYLHCVESNEIETAAEDTTETRGERITGEAFDDRGKIQCFGLYAVVGSEEVLATSTTYTDPGTSVTSTINSKFTEILRSSLAEDGGWYVKEQDLLFADAADMWTDAKTGNFYGFAPLPGWDGTGDGADANRTRCYTVNTDNPASPTVTFTMQPEEEYNKDILMAKKTGVTKSEKDTGIEMQFKHVLSALKFKLDDDDTDGNGTNDFTYDPAQTTSTSDDYYLQLKSITVEGIYNQGTMEIGGTAWTPESSTGSCTSVLNRSFSTVTGDGQINTDAKCMMVLPQTISSSLPNKDAKLIITVDVTRDAAGADIFRKDVTFEASLNGLTWEPGHTYTYKISKDNKAKEYYLTSTNGRSDEAFMFEVNGDITSGYTEDFDVTSYAELSDDGSPATTATVPWHFEYSEDDGSTWTAGLPLGFKVKNPSGVFVGANSAIPGSETPVTYTLEAPVRLDGSPAIASLTSHDYSTYVGNDGYYDLSLHGLGWTAREATTVRNTANCYIINGYGKFEIPLVYGNGIKMGQENPKAYQYAWAQNTTYDESGLTYPHGHSVFCDHNGNQINHAWMSAQLSHPLSSAEIVWQDHDNIIRSSSVTLDPDGTDYLRFEIRKEDVQPGNILLAVKDGTDIAWSWHIWITVNTDFATTTRLSHTINSHTYYMDVAKYSLGWTNPIIKNNIGTKPFKIRVVQNDKMGKNVVHDVEQKGGIVSSENSSLIYQNGRKDPFPNYGLKVASSPAPSVDASGNITATYEQEDLFTKAELGITDHLRSNTEYSPKYCHKNPNSYVMSRFNWFLENGLASHKDYQVYECWNPEGNSNRGSALGTLEDNYKTHTKTIYDPCPVGFMVPNSGIIQMLLNDTPFSSGTTIEIDDKGHTATAPYNYVTTKSGLRFYANGGRRINTGATDYIRDKTAGFFWTAATFSNGLYGVYYNSTNTAIENNVTLGGGRTVSSGFSVRPIKDDQQDVVAAWSSLPVMTFHEGDALGVQLTPNGSTSNYGIDNLSGVTVHMQDGTDLTLESIINDTNKKNKKLLIRQIKVYFDYTGNTYGVFDVGGLLLGHRTLNAYSISHTLGGNTEKHGQSAYVLVADIPDHWLFSSGWVTKYTETLSTPVSGWNWTDLIPLISQKANITRVEVDLRINYYTN